jgi:hypothetical protein
LSNTVKRKRNEALPKTEVLERSREIEPRTAQTTLTLRENFPDTRNPDWNQARVKAADVKVRAVSVVRGQKADKKLKMKEEYFTTKAHKGTRRAEFSHLFPPSRAFFAC